MKTQRYSSQLFQPMWYSATPLSLFSSQLHQSKLNAEQPKDSHCECWSSINTQWAQGVFWCDSGCAGSAFMLSASQCSGCMDPCQHVTGAQKHGSVSLGCRLLTDLLPSALSLGPFIKLVQRQGRQVLFRREWEVRKKKNVLTKTQTLCNSCCDVQPDRQWQPWRLDEMGDVTGSYSSVKNRLGGKCKTGNKTVTITALNTRWRWKYRMSKQYEAVEVTAQLKVQNKVLLPSLSKAWKINLSYRITAYINTFNYNNN